MQEQRSRGIVSDTQFSLIEAGPVQGRFGSHDRETAERLEQLELPLDRLHQHCANLPTRFFFRGEGFIGIQRRGKKDNA